MSRAGEKDSSQNTGVSIQKKSAPKSMALRHAKKTVPALLMSGRLYGSEARRAQRSF
jgi:hypothetical protein